MLTALACAGGLATVFTTMLTGLKNTKDETWMHHGYYWSLVIPVLIMDDSLVIVSRSYHKGKKIKGTYDDVEGVLSGFKNGPGYLPQVVRTKH